MPIFGNEEGKKRGKYFLVCRPNNSSQYVYVYVAALEPEYKQHDGSSLSNLYILRTRSRKKSKEI